MAFCTLVLAGSGSWAATGAALDTKPPPTTPARTASTSHGLPWDGHLERPVRLHPSAVLRPLPHSERRGNFYGTSELVRLLERAAQSIATRWPGSALAVGDLSALRGGKLGGHHSHRNGRDVDVAFFMRDEQGQSSQFRRFVAFGLEGVAVRGPRALRFDDAKNWALVSTLLRDPGARVQYIFVAQTLRTRLLMEGRRRGEGDAFLRTAAAVLVEPREGERHDDHFHVRIYCPRDDRPECQDSEPYWPWYDGLPPQGAHAELPVIRWRTPEVALPRDRSR